MLAFYCLFFCSANPFNHHKKLSKAKDVMKECSFCRFKSCFSRQCVFIPSLSERTFASAVTVMIKLQGRKTFRYFYSVCRKGFFPWKNFFLRYVNMDKVA